MFNNDYMAYALITVGIFTLYMAVINLLRSKKSNSRIKNVVDLPEEEVADDYERGPSALLQLCERLLSKFRGSSLIRPDIDKEDTKKLMLAGINSPSAITYYLFFKKIVQPIILLPGLYVCYKALTSGAETSDVMEELILGSIVVIIGLRGADLYVMNRRKKREQQLVHSFPEVMDLLLVCIEAGLGLEAALTRVCKELRDMHPEVIAEFDRTRFELTMIGDRVVALQNLADRTGLLSFNTLVSALIQTEKFGTSLVDTLRVLSEEQRITRLYAIEQKAARIPVLVTIPLILFIMPAFIMIILGPPIINVMNQGGIFGSH